MAQMDTFANQRMEVVHAKRKIFHSLAVQLRKLFWFFCLEISVDLSAKSALMDTTTFPNVRRVNVIHWGR